MGTVEGPDEKAKDRGEAPPTSIVEQARMSLEGLKGREEASSMAAPEDVSMALEELFSNDGAVLLSPSEIVAHLRDHRDMEEVREFDARAHAEGKWGMIYCDIQTTLEDLSRLGDKFTKAELLEIFYGFSNLEVDEAEGLVAAINEWQKERKKGEQLTTAEQGLIDALSRWKDYTKDADVPTGSQTLVQQAGRVRIDEASILEAIQRRREK